MTMQAASKTKVAKKSIKGPRPEAKKARMRARSRRRWIKRGLIGAAAIAFVALVVVAAMPSPIGVDVATVERRAIAVRLLEPGKTRLRDRYIVRAPTSGNLQRITLWPGDEIVGSRVVARLNAISSPLLSAQDRDRARGQLTAARASLEAARAESKRAALAVEKLAADVAKVEKLVARGASPEARLTELRHAHKDAVQSESSSRYRVSVALGQRRAAEAVLGIGKSSKDGGGTIELHAPIAGTVLRVHRRDEGPVAAGEPILELGDLGSLEIVSDVLTSDAVTIPPNAVVRLHGWGGSEETNARVSHIEPAGFTRISALGVEEQRVNVIARFDSPPPARLGDAFGVEAEIVISEEDDALVVPAGALFRRGGAWSAFNVENGRAVLVGVELGLRSDFDAEVRSGLSAGDTVVIHPPDQMADGAKVEPR